MSEDSDLRLEMQLKNNVLYKAIYSRWPTIMAFCEAAEAVGVHIGHASVCQLINFTSNPRRERDGKVRRAPTAERIAAFLCVDFDTLFPPGLYAAIVKPRVTVDIDSKLGITFSSAALQALPASVGDPSANADKAHFEEQLHGLLDTLTFREREVLKMRYNLDHDPGGNLTLREIAQILKISYERVRSIETKAIRKLQHPSRSQHLRDFLPETEPLRRCWCCSALGARKSMDGLSWICTDCRDPNHRRLESCRPAGEKLTETDPHGGI